MPDAVREPESAHKSPTIAELTGNLTFSVRAGYEWAEINIRPFKGGVSFMADSSFGHYAYVWGAIGERTWQNFLTGCDYGYFMNKAAENHGRVWSLDETVSGIKRRADELVEQGVMSKQVALCHIDEISHDFQDSKDAWGMEAWGSNWCKELYGGDITSVEFSEVNCPQAEGFWEQIWVPGQLYRCILVWVVG